jgi:hypothetical protein
MPVSHSHSSVPSLAAIERPHCSRCQTRMDLARIVPGPKGYDFRNFECAKCDHAESRMICTEPMTSGAANWINGDLWPPK